jgi:hypothetical protein
MLGHAAEVPMKKMTNAFSERATRFMLAGKASRKDHGICG